MFWQVLPFLAAGVVLALASAPGLNLLQLGDDVARSLGMSPGRHKALGIAAVMLLTLLSLVDYSDMLRLSC